MIGTLPGPLGSWARLLGPGLAGVNWRRLGRLGRLDKASGPEQA